MSLYQPHEVRVIDEKICLDEKLGKLASFIARPDSGFELLHETDQDLMRKQLEAMSSYSAALAQRIARFKPRKEALNLPVIDMSALADTVAPGVRFKDGAQ